MVRLNRMIDILKPEEATHADWLMANFEYELVK